MCQRPSRLRPPPPALASLVLPDWSTEADLASWLGLTLDELDHFAGPARQYRERTATPRQPHAHPTPHYRGLLVPKRRGGLRLIEAPMPRLKTLQRRLLDDFLQQLPCHEAAHGFVRGRNVATHAAGHAGQDFVIRFDLRDFFPSIGRARVSATLHLLEGRCGWVVKGIFADS